MITLTHYLTLSSVVFAISIVGLVLNRKNLITVLMCLELMLLAINTQLIAFSAYWDQLAGQIFVFFILAIAAVESAVGLAILVLLYQKRRHINVEQLNFLEH